jgi:tetratricopeptide (TPR) repeat protein
MFKGARARLQNRRYIGKAPAPKAFSVILALVLAAAAVSEAITPNQLNRLDQLKKNVAELFEQCKYKHAVPLLEKILSIDPMDETASRYLVIAEQQEVEGFCEEAHEAYEDGAYEKAIVGWEKVLEINRNDVRAEKMIEVVKNLMRHDILDSMYAKAGEFLKAGDHESAVNELEKILLLRPGERRAREMLITSRQVIVDARIQGHYERADGYMKEEKYDLAIDEWKKILRIDENQEEASRFIAAARRNELDSMYDRAKELHESGDYLASRDMYNKVMSENPTDEDVKKVVTRLSDTIKVVQKIDGKGRVWDMLRRGLSNHIETDGNPQAAIAAAWYAEQLEPSNEIAFAVRAFLEREHLMVFRSMEPPIRDMNIIDQYLFGALNHIYEGRYDLAIEECSIVLELEPQNTLALKRLGSAYFALGKKDKAREAWEEALQLSPDDNELKLFIKRLK